MIDNDYAKNSSIKAPRCFSFNRIYRCAWNITPRFVHELIYFSAMPLLSMLKEREKKFIIHYYRNNPNLSYDEKEVLQYLQNNPFSHVPYSWSLKYNKKDIVVEYDHSAKLRYVLCDGKRLYFRKHSSNASIRKTFHEVSKEMDIHSAHRYVTGENHIVGTIDGTDGNNPKTGGFFVAEGDVVADVGCAEGNFSISIIDTASHVYLFERDPDWIQALKLTFKGYENKITIVNKYVSNYDSHSTVTLDTFFKDKRVNFIKADIEGSELEMLQGAKELLTGSDDIKLAVCTYHKENDAQTFSQYFEEIGYETHFPPGLIVGRINNNSRPLLKGVIRARRQNESLETSE